MTDRTALQVNCVVCGARTVSTVGSQINGEWHCYNCAEAARQVPPTSKNLTLATEVREVVAALAAGASGMSLHDWIGYSNTLLRAAAALEDSPAETTAELHWPLIDTALQGAANALPVLFTMLTKVGLRDGAMVADEINANVLCAIKQLAHAKRPAEKSNCSPSASTDGGATSGRNAPTSSVECPKCRTQLAFEGDVCGLCQ